MKDDAFILKGWRKCCLYACIAGGMNLAMCLIPSWHINAGIGIGEIAFGVSAYLLSRVGVLP